MLLRYVQVIERALYVSTFVVWPILFQCSLKLVLDHLDFWNIHVGTFSQSPLILLAPFKVTSNIVETPGETQLLIFLLNSQKHVLWNVAMTNTKVVLHGIIFHILWSDSEGKFEMRPETLCYLPGVYWGFQAGYRIPWLVVWSAVLHSKLAWLVPIHENILLPVSSWPETKNHSRRN